MEKKLKSLNKARINYSNMIVGTGKEYFRHFPFASLSEFLEYVKLPCEEISDILNEEQKRLKRKRSKELKRARLSG